MHELISTLFIFTTFQFIISAAAWATMLFGLMFGSVYSNTHKFDDKNWKYYLIILSPFIISSALLVLWKAYSRSSGRIKSSINYYVGEFVYQKVNSPFVVDEKLLKKE